VVADEHRAEGGIDLVAETIAASEHRVGGPVPGVDSVHLPGTGGDDGVGDETGEGLILL